MPRKCWIVLRRKYKAFRKKPGTIRAGIAILLQTLAKPNSHFQRILKLKEEMKQASGETKEKLEEERKTGKKLGTT